MELVLKTDNADKLARIITLAKKLNVAVEQRDSPVAEKPSRGELVERILSFNAETSSAFGDAVTWQRHQRKDRDLPFTR